MVAVNPSWIDGVALDGFRLRRVDTVLTMTGGTHPLSARSGVVPGSNGLNVTLSGTTITVDSGIALVYFAGQGVYRAALTSASTLTLTAAHATLPRIDLVYLRIWDNTVDASGLNQADPVYLAGTASSTPSAPTPAGTIIYMPLAQISVPASGGGSPTVNNTVRPITVAPGGILPSSTAPAGPYVGQYYDSGSGLLRWNGSAWRQVNPYTPVTQAQVSQPGSFTAGGFTDFPAVNWPPLTFTVPPSGLVWISIGGAVMNTNTTTSSGWMAWRASGGVTEVASEANGLATVGARTYATRRVLRSWTPGASVTLTPQYLFSSVGTLTTVTRADNGLLAVEPVAAA
jgi:hypothetical protein